MRIYDVFRSLLIAIVFCWLACGSDNSVAPIVDEPPIEEPEDRPIVEDEALAQLLNCFMPDIIFNFITTSDDESIISFQTSLEFRYTGDDSTVVPISVVRGVIVWYTDGAGNSREIGTSIGHIVDTNGQRVGVLEPGQLYYYLSEWDNEPFNVYTDDGWMAVYSNFYALNYSPTNLSKRAARAIPSYGKSFR